MATDSAQDLVVRLRRKGGKSVPTSAFARLQKTASMAARAGLGALAGGLRGDGLGSLSPESMAQVVESLGELKGVAMKVGQTLSYLDTSLSPETRRLLSVLQVMSQPADFWLVRRTVEQELGARAVGLLSRMEREPAASASVGQVHRSRLDDGTCVAVKVRHPGIEEAIRSDLRTAAIGTLFASLAAPGLAVEEMLVEAEARFLEECDYALEAKRQMHFRDFFADHAALTIPEVHPWFCGPRVLTSTWHEGASLDAFLAKAPFAAERVRASRALYEFYVGSLYRHGLFNADPHPGNLLFAADGRVTILDHGCVRAFEPPVVEVLVQLSRAVREDDTRGMQDALRQLGMSRPSLDFDVTRALLRGLFAPLFEMGQHRVEPEHAISMRQVAKLRRGLLRVRLPGRLLFLFRIRVGLYAVLARIGARLDWMELEEELCQSHVGH